jgi:tRNA pseudouridine38-40 synthase
MADLLPTYHQFYPFCKTHSSVDSYTCILKSARWEHRPEAQRLIFYITANRFLRGMVRLIVGAGISVGNGQVELSDVREALDTQTFLKKSLSVPPEGLFLTDVKYPFVFLMR